MLTHRVGTAAGGGLPGPPAPVFPCLAVIGSWLMCPGHNSELPDGIGDNPQALLHPQEGLPEGLIHTKHFGVWMNPSGAAGRLVPCRAAEQSTALLSHLCSRTTLPFLLPLPCGSCPHLTPPFLTNICRTVLTASVPAPSACMSVLSHLP